MNIYTSKRMGNRCAVMSQFEFRLWMVSRLQMMPCFIKSACSSPDTQPNTYGSWTKS
jgi:hypothetical protein